MIESGDITVLSVVSAVFLLIFLRVVLGILHRYINFLTYPLRGVVKGPKCNFLVGQFANIRREPFMQPHLRWIQNITGWDVPFVYYSVLFGRPSILVLDKDIVKTALMAPYGKEPLRFARETGMLKNVLGNGLVTLKSEDWMRHRQIIQPAFLANKLKEALDATVPCLTKRFIGCWKQTEGREIDLGSHLSSLTLDIIGHVAFSHEFKAVEKIEIWARDGSLPEVDDPFIKALVRPFRPSIIGFIAFVTGMPKISYYLNFRLRRVRKALNKAADEAIQNARKKMTTEKQRSLVQLLLQASEGGSKHTLSDVELRDEVKTFVFAGHETTATWCKMAIYALVTNPDVQEKVYQDISSHSPGNGEPLDLKTVEKMEYFHAFLQEVLRLYPPAGVLIRINKQEENFAGYRIPPNARLMLSMYLLHRHPKYWDDPEKCLPERWLQKGEENEEFQKRIRFAFIPFSAGGHNCIGQRFATIEAKLIMAELVRNFELRIAPSQTDTKFTFSNLVVSTLKPDIKVVVKSRK
uniref:Cytochrome P450 n=1 Tax=Helicotheca tamesis TaxID=374047 RepID=A0A7S2IK07_9STRA|mmetsp:Transcript_9670/g.13532  ORF Transcript_9670/g.13532 Transcript_9670/m.13532 type:complete len:522 (+) Transcript_9670:82-1647(+)|eukprot:CAMPEP_0185729710 /NCGR_PEP_ID=MMETSP1171-20130828/6991_1 /TAXON_ID=374046 /ORGANISM="Helicotheca tamensis, Strain CCMP826" /LENGTH=521 /DNA_ID=CAMNT_0028398613 /DNA_START=37 /DNA_END=1602 /DNA_ORIENTATION=+